MEYFAVEVKVFLLTKKQRKFEERRTSVGCQPLLEFAP
jgi:hypothetical protein